MLLSEGQMSDFKGAALMIDALPAAKALLADKGYDADFRDALAMRGMEACIFSKLNRKRIFHATGRSTASATRSRTASAASKIAHPHPLRPMRPHLNVRHLHHSHHHLLAMTQ